MKPSLRLLWRVVVLPLLVILLALSQPMDSIYGQEASGRQQRSWKRSCGSRLRERESWCLYHRGETGSWVRDWNYANRSNYVDLNPGGSSLYQPTPESPFRWESSWRWQDTSCRIETITPESLCRVCHELNMTRIMIGGDSVSGLFVMSLLGLLKLPVNSKSYKLREVILRCSQYHDVRILFARFDMDPNLELNQTHRQFITSNSEGGTILVLNIGAHFAVRYKAYFRDKVAALFQWIRQYTRPDRDLVFFREIVPGHPNCEPRAAPTRQVLQKGFQIYPYSSYNEYRKDFEDAWTDNSSELLYGWDLFEGYNEYIKDILKSEWWTKCHSRLPIYWLNVFNSTILRRDGHYGCNAFFCDCLHYLIPGPTDWFVHLWFSSLLDLVNPE